LIVSGKQLSIITPLLAAKGENSCVVACQYCRNAPLPILLRRDCDKTTRRANFPFRRRANHF
jgi:hypothetical protein